MKNFTPSLFMCISCLFLSVFSLKAECDYASLTLDQVTLNPDNTYDISMTFCASGGYDPCVDITGAFGFMLEGGASILNFPSTLTSPQTNVDYIGFLYNNSVDSLIYFDGGQYLWWTCVDNETTCGPLAPVCQSITITTDILPSKITCGGMEGVGVLVAPYSCTGPNMEVYPNPNFPPPAPCSTFTLVANAGPDQDVLHSYNNSECTSLTVSATGTSTPPLNYAWSSGQSTTAINVCPAITTTYSVTITDGEGCTTTDDVTINVTDIACGNNRVLMCKPNGVTTRCIHKNKVNKKLNNGWSLGPCSSNNMMVNDHIEIFTISQDPTLNRVKITVEDFEDENVFVQIYSLDGQLVKSESRSILNYQDEVTIDMQELEYGLYVISIFDEDGLVKSEKIIK